MNVQKNNAILFIKLLKKFEQIRQIKNLKMDGIMLPATTPVTRFTVVTKDPPIYLCKN